MIKRKVFIPVHSDISTPIIPHDNEEQYVQYIQTGSTIRLYLDFYDSRRNSNVIFIIIPTDILASKY